MSAQQLRNQIRQAFPATEFYGPITACDCEECTHIRNELRHKRWDEISAGFLDLTCSATLLTPEAFNTFLPAYLLRALDNLSRHNVVTEFTVYSLCPNDALENEQDAHAGREDEESRLLPRAKLMSPAQIQAIRAFLVFVEENAADGEWFRPFISRALETVWR
jgi:hypothetical protein